MQGQGEWTGDSSARANAWHSFMTSFTAIIVSVLHALLQQVPAAEDDGAPRAGPADQAIRKQRAWAPELRGWTTDSRSVNVEETRPVAARECDRQ